ncbi:hypothetical protein MMC16_007100 [Acarospora aff. strigata]|nr:hypothetical protein [Acarospora aff. strigata]
MTTDNLPTRQQKDSMASALTFANPGRRAADVIKLQLYPIPAPASNEVLVQLLAAPVNPQDFIIVADMYPIKPSYTLSGESIPGYDGVGRVLEVGSDVKTLAVGDLVIPRSQGFGTWRTHAICGEESLTKVPECLNVLCASILKMTVLPAYFVLEDMHRLRPGDWVIQNAGTSSIAQMVSQLARLKGLHTISVFRDSPSSDGNDRTRASLQQMGADIALSESELDSTDQLDGKRIVLALDSVWGSSAEKMAAKIPSGALFINFGALTGGGPTSTIQLTHGTIFWRSITLKPYRSTNSLALRSQQEFEDLVAWLVSLFDKQILVMPDHKKVGWSLDGDAPEELERRLKEALATAQGTQIGKKKCIFEFRQ